MSIELGFLEDPPFTKGIYLVVPSHPRRSCLLRDPLLISSRTINAYYGASWGLIYGRLPSLTDLRGAVCVG